MNVTPAVGFAGPVELACVPPANSSILCAFSPAAVTGGGQAVLTIQTIAATGKLKVSTSVRQAPDLPWRHTMQIAAAAGVLLLLMPNRRRHLPALLTLLLAVALAAGGCSAGIVGTTDNASGGSSGPVSGGTAGSTGTPLGTALLSVTGASADTTLRHVYTYQVTVQ